MVSYKLVPLLLHKALLPLFATHYYSYEKLLAIIGFLLR